ncbi:MAG: DUF6644 family protein [Gammaproteobacteria bacterium]
MATLDWIEANLGVIVYTLPWTWPILETLHFFGLCMLLGGLLVIDLRLLGFNRVIPAVSVHDLLPFVIAGFVINLITGIGFFVGDPHRYAINIAFQLKMVLVVLAGLNALYYQFKLAPELDGWTESSEIPVNAKVVGATSLVLWFGVLAYGRLIPYMGTG